MKKVKLHIVGDVCLKDISDDTYTFDKDLLAYLKDGDLRIANLECSVTRTDNKLPYQTLHLKAEPVMSTIYDTFDVYSIANNHIMDYGEGGLLDTIEFLNNTNKSFFGAGKNKNEALLPIIKEINGIKIAFIAFNRFNVASSSKAGTAPEDFKTIIKSIKQLKQNGCFVILYPHWNYQWIKYPAPDEKNKGYKLIDAGADIIVGAHPHIVQGHETYKDKSIYHSLGNFVFRNTKYTKNIPEFGQSFVLTIEINEDLSYVTSILPTKTNNDGVTIMNADDKQKFLEHFSIISNVLVDKKKSNLLFYEEGKIINKYNSFVWNEVKKDYGIRGVIENYKIANWQDFKRKLYSILF